MERDSRIERDVEYGSDAGTTTIPPPPPPQYHHHHQSNDLRALLPPLQWDAGGNDDESESFLNLRLVKARIGRGQSVAR